MNMQQTNQELISLIEGLKPRRKTSRSNSGTKCSSVRDVIGEEYNYQDVGAGGEKEQPSKVPDAQRNNFKQPYNKNKQSHQSSKKSEHSASSASKSKKSTSIALMHTDHGMYHDFKDRMHLLFIECNNLVHKFFSQHSPLCFQFERPEVSLEYHLLVLEQFVKYINDDAFKNDKSVWFFTDKIINFLKERIPKSLKGKCSMTVQAKDKILETAQKHATSLQAHFNSFLSKKINRDQLKEIYQNQKNLLAMPILDDISSVDFEKTAKFLNVVACDINFTVKLNDITETFTFPLYADEEDSFFADEVHARLQKSIRLEYETKKESINQNLKEIHDNNPEEETKDIPRSYEEPKKKIIENHSEWALFGFLLGKNHSIIKTLMFLISNTKTLVDLSEYEELDLNEFKVVLNIYSTRSPCNTCEPLLLRPWSIMYEAFLNIFKNEYEKQFDVCLKVNETETCIFFDYSFSIGSENYDRSNDPVGYKTLRLSRPLTYSDPLLVERILTDVSYSQRRPTRRTYFFNSWEGNNYSQMKTLLKKLAKDINFDAEPFNNSFDNSGIIHSKGVVGFQSNKNSSFFNTVLSCLLQLPLFTNFVASSTEDQVLWRNFRLLVNAARKSEKNFQVYANALRKEFVEAFPYYLTKDPCDFLEELLKSLGAGLTEERRGNFYNLFNISMMNHLNCATCDNNNERKHKQQFLKITPRKGLSIQHYIGHVQQGECNSCKKKFPKAWIMSENVPEIFIVLLKDKPEDFLVPTRLKFGGEELSLNSFVFRKKKEGKVKFGNYARIIRANDDDDDDNWTLFQDTKIISIKSSPRRKKCEQAMGSGSVYFYTKTKDITMQKEFLRKKRKRDDN